MVTYTPPQLQGSGSLGENIDSGVTKTLTFTNNVITTNYFTLETTPNPSGFYINDSSPQNINGSWVISYSRLSEFISSSYIDSVVMPSGNSSLTFTPSNNVIGSTYYLKGTGNLTLTVS